MIAGLFLSGYACYDKCYAVGDDAGSGFFITCGIAVLIDAPLSIVSIALVICGAIGTLNMPTWAIAVCALPAGGSVLLLLITAIGYACLMAANCHRF